MMRTKYLNKIIPFTLTAALSLAVTQNVLAVGPLVKAQVAKNNSSNVINAINNLGNKIEAIAIAGEATTNQIANAVDKELSNVIPLNTEQDAANTIVSNATTQNVQNSIHQDLAQFPNNTLTFSSSTDPTAIQSQNEKLTQDSLTNNLSLGVNASDTLYSDVTNIDSATYDTGYPESKPTNNNDNFFDINSLMGTDSFTPTGQQAAQYFITYLTRSYQDQTAGINFNQLRNYLNQYTSDPVTLGEKLQAFRSNIDYQNYQLNVRSNTAAKSVALNVFNKLLAERTPLQSTDKNQDPTLESISNIMGVTPQQITVPDPNNPGQTMQVWSYVSPLQMNNYMANHRINDPSWYQQVASGSTQDLLRKLVVIMAESESIAQQNHLDNEQMMTELATLGIQGAQLNQVLDHQQITKVNNEINSITGASSANTNTDTSTSGTDSSADAAEANSYTGSTTTSTSGS